MFVPQKYIAFSLYISSPGGRRGRDHFFQDSLAARLCFGAVLYLLASAPAHSQETHFKSKNTSFFVYVGYLARDISSRQEIDTHPDDFFLPNASHPGSAGVTEISGAHFVTAGGGFRRDYGAWELGVDAGVLNRLNSVRSERQNANDQRPRSMGSFVFSDLAPTGFTAGVDMSYKPADFFSVGVRGEFVVATVQHGRNRFAADEILFREKISHFSGGPVITFSLTKFSYARATAQFGESDGYGVSVIAKF